MGKLMKNIPNYYRTSKVAISILEAAESELSTAKAAIQNTLNQFFVLTADTALRKWEADLGLLVSDFKPDGFRRSNILSRLRGHGTVTATFIKNIAESYSYGAVEVVEDYGNYSMTVHFVGTVGLPPNLEDLIARLEELRPAHIELKFEYTFVQYIMLEGYTHAVLAGYTHEQIRVLRRDDNA